MRIPSFLIPTVLATLVLTACGKDNEPGDDPTPPTPESGLTVKSTIPAEGAAIEPAAKYTIKVEYSAQISLNTSLRPTLNNRNISARANGSTLEFECALEAETQYTLSIPDRYVLASDGRSYAGAFTLTFSTTKVAETPVAFDKAPVNPSATAEARKVYATLLSLHGKQMISGAMANVNNNNDFAAWIDKVTGKYPGLTCYDFIHLPESPANWIDYGDISAAREQWSKGGLVSYMWHWRAPDSEADYRSHNTDKYGYNLPTGESPTSFDIREALKPGTWQNEFILEDIDRVAGYLKALADAGIPVLWRPLHEAAGSYQWGAWFWWGAHGPEYTRQLWRLMYDRLVNHHHLNNLIWVWTAQYEPNQAAWMREAYPGDEYVDIVGADLYEKSTAPRSDIYKAMIEMTSGRKLVALSETGLVPDPQKCMADGAPWAWFMVWYTYDIHKGSATTDSFGNTTSWLRQVMESTSVLDRSGLSRLLK